MPSNAPTIVQDENAEIDPELEKLDAWAHETRVSGGKKRGRRKRSKRSLDDTTLALFDEYDFEDGEEDEEDEEGDETWSELPALEDKRQTALTRPSCWHLHIRLWVCHAFHGDIPSYLGGWSRRTFASNDDEDLPTGVIVVTSGRNCVRQQSSVA